MKPRTRETLKEILLMRAHVCMIVLCAARLPLRAISYTQPGVLDDTIPTERKLGIEAGFVWKDVAEATIVYADYGISEGMKKGVLAALAKKQPVEYRYLFQK